MNRVIKLLTKNLHECTNLKFKTRKTCVQRTLSPQSAAPNDSGRSLQSIHPLASPFQAVKRPINLKAKEAKVFLLKSPLSLPKSTSWLMLLPTSTFSGTELTMASLSKTRTSSPRKSCLTTSRPTNSRPLCGNSTCITSQKPRPRRTSTASLTLALSGERKNFLRKLRKKRKLSLKMTQQLTVI